MSVSHTARLRAAERACRQAAAFLGELQADGIVIETDNQAQSDALSEAARKFQRSLDQWGAVKRAGAQIERDDDDE